MIDIAKHNAQIAEIERARTILNSSKPVQKLEFSCIKGSGFRFDTSSDGTIDSTYCHRSVGPKNWNGSSIKYCREFAACVIKATGPITQEELDAVVES